MIRKITTSETYQIIFIDLASFSMIHVSHRFNDLHIISFLPWVSQSTQGQINQMQNILGRNNLPGDYINFDFNLKIGGLVADTAHNILSMKIN